MSFETRSILDGRCTIHVGDCLDVMRSMPSGSVDCVVTSPPYWGLRDYGVEGQIGLEPTLGQHLAVMVEVFAEVWRILKPQGTLWLNYGDCYATTPNGKSAAAYKAEGDDDRTFRDKPFSTVGPIYQVDNSERQASRRGRSGNLGNGAVNGVAIPNGRVVAGGFLKPKDLCMIPNRLAIALQEAGWWVRSEIIWHKPNPMPESVYDRPTTAHEKVFLLTKGEEYFYDHEAIREPVTGGSHARKPGPNSRQNVDRVPRSRKFAAEGNAMVKAKRSFAEGTSDLVETRNARNVWSIAPRAFREAHFATFPPALAERCIKAGTPKTVCGCCGVDHGCGPICETFDRVPGTVFDPFGGAGTVGLVAEQLGLRSILIELNPEYADIAVRRIEGAERKDAA
ncbi:DNA adenine methylase [Sinorhizobium sp. GL2]|nr:DNA adenine methylase [Sinorhizobium sp. GL2]